tara:strand:+ start:1261 stop:1950 length:690 start_codon:yes stop_codon:yes gene_type:complete
LKKLPQVFFILLVLLNAYFFENQQKALQFFIEPFIVPTLFIYYWLNSYKRNFIFIMVFLFLWMGDLLILFENNAAFLKWGVFCYWIMLLLLSYNFFQYFKRYALGAHLLGILFYGSYLLVFLSHVFNSLGDMRIHGVIYGLTLSLLGSFTLMELLRNYTKPKALLTLGLLIFSVRDVLITYNKRYFEEDVFTYPIPILHALGFFMIMKSFMLLEESKKEELNSDSDEQQ